MRLLSPLVLSALMCFIFSTLRAQDDIRFSPFDCREHSEEQETFNSNQGIAESLPAPFVLKFMAPEPAIVADTLDAWKRWTFVENFAFGKDRGDMPMITDMQALHPFFRDQIFTLIAACKAKGIDLAVVETYRTHAKQHEYKSMGKRYTNSGAGKSKHQYGLAIDVVPLLNDQAVWDNVVLWRKVGVIGERLGLRWGGRWKKPYDPGHFEWTGGTASATLYSGTLPTVPFAVENYPCLEEDIRILRRHWSEWELSQSSMTRR